SLEERAALEQLVSKGKAAARKLTHARVLLLADDSEGGESPDEEIVAALGTSPRTVARVRKRLVTEGFQAALDHRPQPARPDKIKIRGHVDQRLVELAWTDPPPGPGRGKLELPAGESVVVGLGGAISLERVRQALKKTTSSPGSSRPGVCGRTPTPSSSGGWRTSSRPTDCLTTCDTRWSASTRRASSSSARSGRPAGRGRASPLWWTTSTNG